MSQMHKDDTAKYSPYSKAVSIANAHNKCVLLDQEIAKAEAKAIKEKKYKAWTKYMSLKNTLGNTNGSALDKVKSAMIEQSRS
jgi:hypothetical protein